ncbi:NAD(P)-binding protein [Polyplosphaeria fusca]|uniref:Arsenite methyltransferase n=1 Tax=Polyplosphaeria fusca TaxID=682080 RepID=A0A9P4QNN8_9PLEO|nr:NAD(P)-binding protein [Polyplosphaeria fusca]
MDSTNVYKQVQDHYGSLARAEKPSYSGAIAQAFGYTEEELNSIPRDANLGLGCGNPLAIASLQEASFIDSQLIQTWTNGAGFDVFLVAKKVGPKGRAIGVDMNKDMLARAHDNHAKSGGAENVSFVEGQITSIPIEDGIADCIISNCVTNLVPEAEKPAVFTEMARLLKPGGRVAISDILARKPFPTELRESVAAYVGCVAGCGPKEDYERLLAENGFRAYEGKQENEDVANCCSSLAIGAASEMVRETPCCSEKVTNCCSKTSSQASISEHAGSISTPEVAEVSCCSELRSKTHSGVAASWSFADIDINEWAGSFKIFAVKIGNS